MNEQMLQLINALTNCANGNAMNGLSSVQNVAPVENKTLKDAMRIVARELLASNADPDIQQLAENEVCVEMFLNPLSVYLSNLKLKVIKDPFGNPIGLMGDDK